jgi:predicted Zn finger-like uncharacterized protein
MAMKLSCQTCGAKYSIADNKVCGKIVKIRCKKCGAIIVASGLQAPATPEGGQVWAPESVRVDPAPAPAPRPGERNEQSVLFSLAALSQARVPDAPPAPTSDASGLLDIRMLSRAMPTPPSRRAVSDDILNLGFGGVLTPQLLVGDASRESAPAAGVELAYRAHAPRPPARVWLIGAVAIALATAVPLALLKRAPAPAAHAEPVVVAASSGAMSLAPTEATADAAVAPVGDVPPLASAAPTVATRRPAVASLTQRPAATASAHPVETVARCCSGEAQTACEMRRSVGAACRAADGPAAFDGATAARALSTVSLRACSNAGGPTGAGHARVTFQPGGTVSDVVVDTSELSGTATERCVAQAYRRVKVAAFSGPALTVGKRFVVSGDP